MRTRFPHPLVALRRLGFLTALLMLAACRGAHPGTAPDTLGLHSANFSASGPMPASLTCDGAGGSPALAWNAGPAGTRSFALLVTDPDAPDGTFTHWVLFNIPAAAQSLAAGLSAQGEQADGSRQGANDFGQTGYGGPCPPGHAPHRYVFELFALDTQLDLPAGASRAQVEAALHSHVLAQGRLVGVYHR